MRVPATRIAMAFLVAGGLLAVGCRTGSHGVAPPAPPPDAATSTGPLPEVPGLPNLGRVDAGLFRSAQPTAEGLREAKRLGVRTVVDLRSAHADDRLLAGLSLASVRLPMHEWSVGDDEVAAFLRVATDPANRPVLVHCASGMNRTGALVAAYRVAVEGWSRSDALREMDAYGASPLWWNLRRYVETFDPARVLAEAARLSPPPIVRVR